MKYATSKTSFLRGMCYQMMASLCALNCAALAHGAGIWISKAELAALPMTGAAWTNVQSAANKSCGTPDLSNQDDPANVCVMAKALVAARTDQASYRADVITALRSIVNSGTYNGRALAIGRELGAYVIAADVIDLKTADPALDTQFRAKIKSLATTPTTGGPSSIVDCAEVRPNNWGLHCGATRIAIALYLGDSVELDKSAKIFKGFLGDRASYSSFEWGDLSWQCNPSAPVGVNPVGCMIQGHPVDGVLPDDQRRGGPFAWPPAKESYFYEALQGIIAQGVLLQRAGYDAFNWQDKAILRAYKWVHDVDNYPAGGDDTWGPHVINYYYHEDFPAPVPSTAGKNVGWTDWTLGSGASNPPPPPPPSSSSACDINKDSAINISDVQLCSNQSIGMIACSTADINKDGQCTVLDVQRVVNAALGGACVTP